VYIQPSEMYGSVGIELTGEVLLNAGYRAESLMKGRAIYEDSTFEGMWRQGRFLTMTEGNDFLTYSKFINRHGDAAKKFMDDMDWLEACAKGAYEREQKRKDITGKLGRGREQASTNSEQLEALPTQQ